MKIYKSLAAIAISMGLTQAVHSSPWPTATADYATARAGERIYIRVLANDAGQNLSINEVNTRTVKLGTVQMNSHRKALFYTPPAGFTGQDSFWYAIKDNRGRTNSTQVFVKVLPAAARKRAKAKPRARTTVSARPRARATTPNRSRDYSGWPTATMDTVSTTKNRPVTIAVLQNDIGDRLRLSTVNDWTVKGGRASIQGDRILYRPKPGYVGQDSFWYNFKDARGRENSTQVKVTITDRRASVVRTSATGNSRGNAGISKNTVHIPMHAGFLKNQRTVWGTTQGTQTAKAMQAASAGSSQLTVGAGLNLRDNQLISYRATDGDYYTVATRQTQGNSIQLKTALPAPIAQGASIWNFYHDGAHPNTMGYRSLVDFALRKVGTSSLNAGKHVLLGDSWFENAGIHERLNEKLNNAHIINRGVSGNTSASLLQRFDRDVAGQQPDVVWLMAGTNDYYQGVSVDAYAANMKALLQKIKAIGAKAVVFDSSVAPSMSGDNSLTEMSHQYARVVQGLIN